MTEEQLATIETAEPPGGFRSEQDRRNIERLIAEVRSCWHLLTDVGTLEYRYRAEGAEKALADARDLERTAWADYQACAAEKDSAIASRDVEWERRKLEFARAVKAEAERDRLTLDLHSARQMVTDTHAALERSERLWQEDERLGRAREDALEARVTELEYLIADHEFEAEEYDALAGCRISICPVCGGHGGHHTHGLNQPCPWGQAAANHRAREAHAALSAREPVEGRDFESMPGVAP